jgi:hypothetical protein
MILSPHNMLYRAYFAEGWAGSQDWLDLTIVNSVGELRIFLTS